MASPSKGKIQPDIKQARLRDRRGQVVRVSDNIRPGDIRIEPAAPARGRARQVAARYAKGVFREDLTKIKGGVAGAVCISIPPGSRAFN